MAEDFNKSDFEEFAKKFNISPVICEEYCKFNDKVIQPSIKKSYLAPLIYVVVNLINERLSEENKLAGNKQEKDSKETLRRYNIKLYERPPSEYGKTFTMKFPYGAVIVYNSALNEKDICISIARELGKLLIEHRIISGSKEENFADLFASIVLDCSAGKP